MRDNKTTLWERYLSKEIGIEFKACLYFFAILFFYCVYRICLGEWYAGIMHMAEMILTCYIMCYLQVYVFRNFDEADSLRMTEMTGMAVCTLIYGALSYCFSWFDKEIFVTFGFALYLIITYLCVFLIYKYKRRIDDKTLNEELRLFKEEHEKVQDRDE